MRGGRERGRGDLERRHARLVAEPGHKAEETARIELAELARAQRRGDLDVEPQPRIVAQGTPLVAAAWR